MPPRILTDTELGGGAQHSRGVVFPAEHGPNSEGLVCPAELRAWGGIGNQVAQAQVGRSGQHTHGLRPDVDVRELHAPCRFRHRFQADDAGDDDPRGPALHPVHLRAGVDQAAHQGVERRVKGSVLTQPVERDPHAWLTNRTSFS